MQHVEVQHLQLPSSFQCLQHSGGWQDHTTSAVYEVLCLSVFLHLTGLCHHPRSFPYLHFSAILDMFQNTFVCGPHTPLFHLFCHHMGHFQLHKRRRVSIIKILCVSQAPNNSGVASGYSRYSVNTVQFLEKIIICIMML